MNVVHVSTIQLTCDTGWTTSKTSQLSKANNEHTNNYNITKAVADKQGNGRQPVLVRHANPSLLHTHAEFSPFTGTKNLLWCWSSEITSGQMQLDGSLRKD